MNAHNAHTRRAPGESYVKRDMRPTHLLETVAQERAEYPKGADQFRVVDIHCTGETGFHEPGGEAPRDTVLLNEGDGIDKVEIVGERR